MTDPALPVPAPGTPPMPWGMDVPTYCMVLHLSLFSGYFIPLAGLVVPIVMWAANKDLDPRIDAHGKVMLNWIISFISYALIGALLCIVLIGFVVLPILYLCAIIFTIIAAVKAKEGVIWKYPLSIPFFTIK